MIRLVYQFYIIYTLNCKKNNNPTLYKKNLWIFWELFHGSGLKGLKSLDMAIKVYQCHMWGRGTFTRESLVLISWSWMVTSTGFYCVFQKAACLWCRGLKHKMGGCRKRLFTFKFLKVNPSHPSRFPSGAALAAVICWHIIWRRKISVPVVHSHGFYSSSLVGRFKSPLGPSGGRRRSEQTRKTLG